jgi:very-short-patch-repair endonuclease
MEPYLHLLKEPARSLRRNMTEAEDCLWQRIRRKQVGGVQFYRQKPLLSFIVDFYCAAAKLVIEVDGAQHYAPEYREKDAARDAALAELGLLVLRFSNAQVLEETDAVVRAIAVAVGKRIPLSPPLGKGEAGCGP